MVSPDRGSRSNSATSSAIRSQNSDACAAETRACRMNPQSCRSRQAELFLYPGEEHLFADSSLAAYDAAAAALLTERVLAFLDRVETPR